MDNKESFKSFFGKLSDFMVNYFNYKIVKNSGKEVTMVCPNHGQTIAFAYFSNTLVLAQITDSFLIQICNLIHLDFLPCSEK